MRTPTHDPLTTAAASAVTHADHTTPEAAVLDAAVAAVLATSPHGGMIDSHALADSFRARRLANGKFGGTWDQCRDYVQHMLREALHVCRHADGHFYHVHPAAVCSDACVEVHAQHQAAARRPASTCCHLETLWNGHCPNGCDD